MVGNVQPLSIKCKHNKRRERLTKLVDRVGQTRLSEVTGIAPAYLYQMSKGKPPNARNVSDSTARKIEDRLGLERGWMDDDTPSMPHLGNTEVSRDLLVSIGKRLVRLRGQLSQSAFESKVGLPQNTIATYEGGDREMGVEVLAALVRAGCNANWLLTGEGPEGLDSCMTIAAADTTTP